ncbi:MAG: DNRLRE domain-containing protein, partial [Minisyncoccota bacterium]
MYKKIYSFLILTSIICSQMVPIFAFAEVIDPDIYVMNISASKDTYVNEYNQDENYGFNNDFRVRSKSTGDNQRALVQFTIPSLPTGTVIQSAKIKLYMYEQASSDINRTYNAYRSLSSWVEGNGGSDNNPVNEVRWDNKPTASSSISASAVVTPGNNKFIEWNVTSDVKSFVDGSATNNGWIITDSSESSPGGGYQAKFRSKEYGTSNERPVLEITYYVYSGSISGKVFNDINMNGVQDDGELGLSAQTISISGPISTSTVTNSLGDYAVSSLPSGSYIVCGTIPNTNWLQSLPSSGSVCEGGLFGVDVVINADSHINKDFGFYENDGSIKIINNTNPSVTLDNFQFALLKDNATTSSESIVGSNEYTFSNLVSGQYSINSILPNNWISEDLACVSGESEINPNSITLIAGQNVVCTQNTIKNASVTVTNYINPVQGTFSFKLTKPTETEEITIFQPVTLANSESRTFTGIIPDTYNLVEMITGGPVGETAVCLIGDTVVDPRVDSIVIPAGANIQCTYNHGDFGVVQGSVFEDMNGDTVKDEIDTSLSGWSVKLYKITEELVVPEGEEVAVPTSVTTEVSSKVTNETGYVFGQLNPGTYKVCEELQPLFTQSLPLANEG